MPFVVDAEIKREAFEKCWDHSPRLHLHVDDLRFSMVVVQTQASLLKSVMSGGRRTKIVALGIGNRVSATELNATASTPSRNNVIRVQDVASLPTVLQQLRGTSCIGKSTQPPCLGHV